MVKISFFVYFKPSSGPFSSVPPKFASIDSTCRSANAILSGVYVLAELQSNWYRLPNDKILKLQFEGSCFIRDDKHSFASFHSCKNDDSKFIYIISNFSIFSRYFTILEKSSKFLIFSRYFAILDKSSKLYIYF